MIMKNLKMTFLCLAVCVLNSSAALAEFQCIQETWIYLKSKSVTGSCVESQALQLAMTEKSYPLLNSETFRVQYWQGAYSKVVATTDFYRHDIYDECSHRSILNEVVPVTRQRTIEFKVDNPNLSNEVDASYQLVPMTSSEAKTAFAKAQSECQK